MGKVKLIDRDRERNCNSSQCLSVIWKKEGKKERRKREGKKERREERKNERTLPNNMISTASNSLPCNDKHTEKGLNKII